ncbi:MAG: T9SS type A sorting domain-containing protein [Bacteroidales bacterium]|nr:T9SS type A sorting domain-containing protein [Bacteroidales bacterium]
MKYFFIIAIILFGFHSYAQITRLCDTYEKNLELEKKHPEISISKQNLDTFTRQWISNNQKDDEVYVIPVVFHVIHNYGVENISKQQIENGIEWMNNDFRKTSSDTGYIIEAFKPIAADCRIEFRLARLDPYGNCTDGITRTQSELTYSANEDIKDLVTAWPREKYLNIWVVYKIASGAAGYSYYPSSVDGSWGVGRDGIVIRYDYVGGIEESSASHGRTLTHEAGHYLNLMHPWGNSNDPELPENCEIDDDVEDTPLTIGHTSCSLYAETCGSLDNVQNYMDYSYCGKMYTIGQKDRMRACLNSSISNRINLWQVSNLIATGVLNPDELAICIPTVDFISDKIEGCAGLTVQFTDRTYNSDIDSTWQWNWSFPGGVPESSTEQNPEVTYNEAGWYDVSLSVTNSAGSGAIAKERKIRVLSDSTGEFAPYLESFENVEWPYNSIDYNKDWSVITRGEDNWERTSLASVTGNASIRIDNRNNIKGTKNTIISPSINISSLTENVRLFFKVAYAKTSTESRDLLLVYSSKNCGDTWSIELVRTSTSLVSNDGSYISSSFVPNEFEWKEFTADMDNYIGYESIRLKFICESSNGNYLYIDDIQVSDLSPVSSINQSGYYASIFPNPSKENSKLVISEIQDNNLNLEIVNLAGKKIYSQSFDISNNSLEIELNSLINPEKGLYFVQISSKNNFVSLKWLIF